MTKTMVIFCVYINVIVCVIFQWKWLLWIGNVILYSQEYQVRKTKNLYTKQQTHIPTLYLSWYHRNIFTIYYTIILWMCEENKMKHFISEIGCKFEMWIFKGLILCYIRFNRIVDVTLINDILCHRNDRTRQYNISGVDILHTNIPTTKSHIP